MESGSGMETGTKEREGDLERDLFLLGSVI